MEVSVFSIARSACSSDGFHQMLNDLVDCTNFHWPCLSIRVDQWLILALAQLDLNLVLIFHLELALKESHAKQKPTFNVPNLPRIFTQKKSGPPTFHGFIHRLEMQTF